MKNKEFFGDALKAYASFIFRHKLTDLRSLLDKKNPSNTQLHSRLNPNEISALKDREIDEYLDHLIRGNFIETIDLWTEKFNKNELPGFLSEENESDIIDLLISRKRSLIEFVPEYTNDVKEAIVITTNIDEITSYQIELIRNNSVSISKKQETDKNLSRLQQILEHTPTHINVYDLETDKSIYNNGAGRKIFGHTPEEVMTAKFSQLWENLVYPEDKAKVRARLNNFKNLKDGETDHLEYRLIGKDGNIVWYYSRANVYKRENGIVKQVLLNGLNITELKEAEEKQKYVEDQLKEAQKIAHIGNYDYDIVNDIIVYTDEAYRIYDLPREKKEFKTADFKALLKPEDAKKFEENLQKAFREESNDQYEGQYRIVLKDNVEKDVFSRAQITRNENGEPIRMMGTVMDISSIKKAEHKLREKNLEVNTINQKLEESQEEIRKINEELEDRIKSRTKELKDSEEQYRFLAENVPQMFWTARPDGGLDFHNNNLYAYTGATLEEVGEWEWQNFIHPKDLPIMLEKWMYSLKTSTVFETEFRIKRADGAYRWHLVRTVPLKNAKEEVIKWMGSATDIDEQKRYAEELKQKNEQLIRSNNDLDNFIYTASHDLKAPISNVEGLLNALNSEMSEECKSQGENSAILSMINESVLKFKKTIFDLTEITRAQKSSEEATQEIDIKEILQDVYSMIDDLIKTNKAIIKTDFDSCTAIWFSRKNFKSILYNLLSNAIKFRSPHRVPEILIKTECTDQYIELSVQDNGQGFDANQKSKIFEMFKRLQSDAQGSGVGLYLVKRIITNAGGKVEVESERGKGSVFKLYFPNKEND